MFESLKSINERVFNRAKTVEKNIKAASNSFYDSYLDLTEELLKTIAETANIELTTRMTCGDILRYNGVKSFLTETLKLDDYTYGKLCDYIPIFSLCFAAFLIAFSALPIHKRRLWATVKVSFLESFKNGACVPIKCPSSTIHCGSFIIM